ncbi:MAG: epoxyqueuosine reductase, partial [Candidatus Adiutrix sp.]|nr:epoxyqueuosine reductase [Candidatus Adiutrix sp.]
MKRSPQEMAGWLEQQAIDFMNGPENDLGLTGGAEAAFGPPLVGFAAGDDPLWARFKEVVHPLHWTPAEAFQEAFGEEASGRLSVMVWALPQTEATRADQKKEKNLPAERWVRNRFLGHARACDGLARKLISRLAKMGIRATAPELLPSWRWLPEGGPRGLASQWSQRHAALAAGLGTFGLSDGLITPVGKAIRLGALVLAADLPPTPGTYQGPYENCLYFNSGVCGQCVKRCPALAISKEGGHDKEICRRYLYGSSRPWLLRTWPEFAGGPDDLSGAFTRAPGMTACGLCQVSVPCEKGIPPRPEGISK